MSIPDDVPADPVARVDGLIARVVRRMPLGVDWRMRRPAMYAIAQTAVLRRLLDECATDARSSPH